MKQCFKRCPAIIFNNEMTKYCGLYGLYTADGHIKWCNLTLKKINEYQFVYKEKG